MTRYNIQWSAKTLTNQMKQGKLNFDNAVQRSLVWDNAKKSLLIHSMMYGYAIPPFYFTRDPENKIYDSLDGKQRSNTIAEFINSDFALGDIPPVCDDEGNEYNFSGLMFPQLPEWAQDLVKDYSLTIYYYEDMTETEIREFFSRLNNGKPLSPIELTRVNTPSLTLFQNLAKHEVIQFITTASGKKRFTDELIAMQLYGMLEMEHPDFSTKAFREWVQSIEAKESTLEAISNGLDRFARIYNSIESKTTKRILKTRTHFISAVYYCCLSLEVGKTDKQALRDLVQFFSGYPSINEGYNNSVAAGSAKPDAILTRKNAMKALAEQEGGDIEEVFDIKVQYIGTYVYEIQADSKESACQSVLSIERHELDFLEEVNQKIVDAEEMEGGGFSVEIQYIGTVTYEVTANTEEEAKVKAVEFRQPSLDFLDSVEITVVEESEINNNDNN